VTATGGGAVAGATVVALHAGTFAFAAGDVTDASGNYDVPVDPGDYLVGFADTTGAQSFEWYDDQPGSGLAGATPVTAAAGSPGVVDVALASTTGTVAGTVTEEGSGDPLADIWAFAIDTTGSLVGVARTAGDGTYTLTGLPTTGVRVRFLDLTDAHVPEYFDDIAGPGAGTDYGSATVVAVAAGATTTVDAGLSLAVAPPPPA
jgi:hypothetical protein